MYVDTIFLAAAKSEIPQDLACGCSVCMGKSTIARGEVYDLPSSALHSVNTNIQVGAATTRFTGSITPGESSDLYSIAVIAGQTYSVALRGVGGNGLDDPLLAVFGTTGAFVNADDDGGAGITSLLTFTATATGNYFLTAQSFAADDVGDYTIDIWVKPPVDAVSDTFAAAVEIDIGTTFGHIDTSGDIDTFKIYLEAGKLYTFQLAAGADYATDIINMPEGEVDTVLAIYAPDGTPIGFNDDINFPSDLSSGFSFLPSESGYYFLDALGYPDQIGGYTLDVTELDPASLDPLDSIDWVDADNIPTVMVNGVPTAYVYFGDSDENFDQTGDDGGSMVTIDWNSFEKQQVMIALEEYTRILGISYVVTEDSSQATFRLLKTESTQYGAYFYPQDPAYGDAQGVGVFNVLSGGWSLEGQASLLQGGYAFAVMLHEFGHAHGLAHPHDNGGGSDIMLGVTGSDSLGFFDLNQGVHTVMSYNDAWQTHPDGPTPYTRSNIDSGWSGTLAAFDIALLQERYGTVARNTGNTVYTLGDANDFGTYYQTIWDSNGTDEIRYDGVRDAQIDLTAATLDYSATGGGVVSFVDGIWGGYTIAGGVVVENASGGSGNDVLIGNAAGNILKGNAGDDILIGGLGNDVLDGGVGFDTVSYVDATSAVTVRLDLKARDTGMGTDSFVSIEGVMGSAFNDTIYGDGGSNALNGGAGNDRIVGLAGNDVIIGGAGRDAMTGGVGADVFTFEDIGDFAPLEAGFRYGDKIDDFSHAQGDKIDLSGLGDLLFIGTAAFSASGVAEVRYLRGSSTAIQIDVNGDGIIDGVLQLNATALVVSDFILA